MSETFISSTSVCLVPSRVGWDYPVGDCRDEAWLDGHRP